MKYFSRLIFINLMLIFYWHGVLLGQEAFYFSSEHGNDLNSGTSATTAWQSLSKLNEVKSMLTAGSAIYLECNSIWYNTSIELTGVTGTESNPIRFTSYGTGNKPEIRGSILISSFDRIDNIWSKTDDNYPSRNEDMKNIAGIYINNAFCPIGKTPNEGYFITHSKGDGTHLSDYDNTWTENQWQGGQIIARTVSWAWDNSYITSSESNVYSLEGFHYRLTKDDTYYFIQNHPNTLDQEFEWAYNDKTLSIYYSGNLNTQQVEMPSVECILRLDKCENIVFENITISKANMYAFDIDEGSGIQINNCKVSYIGRSGIKLYRSDNFYLNGSVFTDCFSNSILINDALHTLIENNKFKRCGIIPGLANGIERPRSAISSYVIWEPLTIQYNEFDSVMIAYQGHYSQDHMYFQYNLIEDYGMVLGDHGAIYLEGESMGSYVKHIKNNIILNGHESTESLTSRGPDTYPHALYLDYDCANVLLDSNTIINCNYGFIYNRVRRNTATNNNIFNPARYLEGIWRSTVLWDSAVGVNFETLNLNVFENNTITHGIEGGDVDFTIHNLSNLLENRIDHNTYIYPFNNNNHIARTIQNYSSYQEYSLNEWQTQFGADVNSTYGNALCKYNASSGIAQEEFAKIFSNPSKKPYYQPLGAQYVDKNGTVYDRGVIIPPYYSITLFYYDETEFPNQTPVILNQSFGVYEQTPQPTSIGKVLATDPDPGQKLNYTIEEGNADNTFRIDPNTGDINLNILIADFHSNPEFILTVQVSDNGIPQQHASAVITINLYEDTENHPPILNDQIFEVQYSTLLPTNIGQIIATDHNSWQDLSYNIIAGNTANNFVLFESNGMLLFRSNLDYIDVGEYTLTVRVTDNGSPALSDEGTITIIISKDNSNQPPLLEDQTFNYTQDYNATEHIGFIIANDPESDSLLFEIVSGTSDIIDINTYTGEITLRDNLTDIDIEQVELLINVYDNGSPSETATATATINITPSSHIKYIDPTFPAGGDGTYSDPLNSLYGIDFQSGYVYLVKHNTSLQITGSIEINSDDVTISSYGFGQLPVISTSSFDYMFKVFDHSDITIQNLQLRGNQSLGGIYLLGPLTDNIVVRNCAIEETDYGIRTINTGNIVIEHCRFASNFNGIFTISHSLKANYNVFMNNSIGVKLVSIANYSNIYNNVFDQNELAISNETANTNLYNNIFHLSETYSKAIISSQDYYSDFNLYHPIRGGFINIDGINYNTLQEIQETKDADFSSLDVSPEFLDAPNGDYKLRQNSPAIDAGVYLGLLIDIEGTPVPHGYAPDIGVIEATGLFSAIEEEQTINSETEIHIYPNPAYDYLTIQFNNIANNSYTVELIDMMGKTLLATNFDVNSGLQNEQINIENLKPGFYYIRIADGKKITCSKIIKQ